MLKNGGCMKKIVMGLLIMISILVEIQSSNFSDLVKSGNANSTITFITDLLSQQQCQQITIDQNTSILSCFCYAADGGSYNNEGGVNNVVNISSCVLSTIQNYQGNGYIACSTQPIEQLTQIMTPQQEAQNATNAAFLAYENSGDGKD